VTAYYERQFMPRLTSEVGSVDTNAEALVSLLQADALGLQHQYISQNPNPLGEKDKLTAAPGDLAYDQAHTRWHPYYRDYLHQFGFYDIFLISADTGDLVYSVFKEVDYATSLKTGPYRDSGLARAYSLAMELPADSDPVVVDFSQYLPSYQAPAAFIAAPIFENGVRVGVLAFQFPLDRLNAIMTDRSGLGETGETYLLGEDQLMRSDSHLDPANRSVVASFRKPALGSVNTQSAAAALAGDTGSGAIEGYNGSLVLSAYAPLNVTGLDWAIFAEMSESEALASIDQLKLSTLILMLVLAGVILIVTFYTRRQIMRPLGQEPFVLEAAAAQMASGDLRLSNSEEQSTGVYRSMRSMAIGLRDIVLNIGSASGQQASAAHELASVTTHTRNIVNQQNEQTDQMAAAIEQMSVAITQVSQNTAESASLAQKIREAVNLSSEDIRKSAGSIEGMAGDLQKADQSIQAVRTDMNGISKILESIQSIADQTNLLALNAAIEAARAGDQGRGFSVVADEVRVLARNTQEATGEISRTIETLVRSTEQASRITAQCNETATGISIESSRIVAQLNETVADVERVADMSTQIASATEQQAATSAEVTRNVSSISRLAAETETAIDQIATASDELAKLSTQMQESVASFTLAD
jgi:methyl-accepting chemotaxis protein